MTLRGIVLFALLQTAAGCPSGSAISPDAMPDGSSDTWTERGVTGAVAVLFDGDAAENAWATGRDYFGAYLQEVLAHAGIPHEVLSRAALLKSIAAPVLLLPAGSTFSLQEARGLEAYVRAGGVLVSTGASSGLESLLGITLTGSRQTAFLRARADTGPFAGITRPLHVFAAARASAGAAEAIATLLDEHGLDSGDAGVTRRVLDHGSAWFIAADMAATLVAIQQGIAVTRDGVPAPDGTAAINDGTLKTDDGIVLDWTLDRAAVNGAPLFLDPVADQLLFHPAHHGKAEVARAMTDIVGYGRKLGLEWWTIGEINAWERLRRKITIRLAGNDSFSLSAPQAVKGATLVFPLAQQAGPLTLALGEQRAACATLVLQGIRCARCVLDLPEGTSSIAISGR